MMKAEYLKGNAIQGSLKWTSSKGSWVQSYIHWADKNSNEKVFWFLKAIIVIPNVIMVPTISLMYFSTPHFVWYIGVTMLLFFGNILVHLAEAPSRIYIPTYHLSIAFMVITSLIFYLVKNILI